MKNTTHDASNPNSKADSSEVDMSHFDKVTIAAFFLAHAILRLLMNGVFYGPFKLAKGWSSIK